MQPLIRKFFQLVAAGRVEIYNEFSLQHELSIFLRNQLVDAKVQFERPYDYFDIPCPCDGFIKKEIDISCFHTSTELFFALELKFPRAGQYPEQMFKACQDIFFLEQLVATGFRNGYFIMVVDDPLFYRGYRMDGIYAYFRAAVPITGDIYGPTGDTARKITIAQRYSVQWLNIVGSLRYFVIEIIGSDEK